MQKSSVEKLRSRFGGSVFYCGCDKVLYTVGKNNLQICNSGKLQII